MTFWGINIVLFWFLVMRIGWHDVTHDNMCAKIAPSWATWGIIRGHMLHQDASMEAYRASPSPFPPSKKPQKPVWYIRWFEYKCLKQADALKKHMKSMDSGAKHEVWSLKNKMALCLKLKEGYIYIYIHIYIYICVCGHMWIHIWPYMDIYVAIWSYMYMYDHVDGHI